MTFRTALLPALAAVDTIRGQLDLAPTTVTIMLRTWSGGLRGRGQSSDATLAVLPPVEIRPISEKEVASSGGRFESGDVRVGPIRPTYTNPNGSPGGFTQAMLDPAVARNGVDAIYRLTQTDTTGSGIAGDYQLITMHNEDPIEMTLVLRRRLTSP